MYCKQCGSYLEPDALTCPVCGAPAPETVQSGEPAGPAVSEPAGPAVSEPAGPAVSEPAGPVAGKPAGNTAQQAGAPGQHNASWESGAGVTGGSATPPSPPSSGEPRYQRPAPPASTPDANAPEPPVKTLEWVWSMILTAIPIVNLVVLLIWSFGSSVSISKRNWARAKLILVAVSTVISVLALIGLFGVTAYFASYGYSDYGYGFDTPYYYY